VNKLSADEQYKIYCIEQYLPLQNAVTLKTWSGVIQGH